MNKHTPGPWQWLGDGLVAGEFHEHKTNVLSASMGYVSCSEDDAALIAAAPDLLEALKTSKLFVEAMIEDQRCGDMFTAAALMLDKINYVINKAEGTL